MLNYSKPAIVTNDIHCETVNASSCGDEQPKGFICPKPTDQYKSYIWVGNIIKFYVFDERCYHCKNLGSTSWCKGQDGIEGNFQ